MACQIVSTRGAVFALWGEAKPADIDQVLAALQRAVAECGHPVLYVTRLPVNAPPPDAAARAHLDRLMPNIATLCSTYHVVLEGEGFGAAIKRGVLIGLFQLGWRRKMFFVHATVEQVVASVTPDVRRALDNLLIATRAQGLLTRSL